MNIPSWILAGAAVLSLVNVVLIGWIIWSIKRIAEDKAKEVLAPVTVEISHIQERLGRIDASLEHMPDADEHRNLIVQLTDLKGDVRVLTASLRGASDLFERLERKVDVIDRYLRQEGK